MLNSRTLFFASTLIAAPLPSLAAPALNAAQAIAQKFSEADAPQPSAPKPSEPVKKKTPAAKPTTTERPSLDYEMDMLRRARAEELEREQSAKAAAPSSSAAKSEDTSAQSKTSATPPAAASAESSKPEPAALVATPHAQEPGVPQQTATDPKLAQTGNAEAPAKPALSETAPAAPAVAAAKPEDVKATVAPPNVAEPQTAAASDTSGQRITFLLSLATDADAVSRPDPILCFHDTCWLSNGYETPAKPMPRNMALALASTESASADSCHGKSACVYRNVAVPADGVLELIEIGSVPAVASNGFSVVADSSCRLDQGDFICDNGLETRDFRMWSVPEATAKSAGPAALEDAIDNDLETGNAQSTNDK